MRLLAGVAGGLMGTLAALGIFLLAAFAQPAAEELVKLTASYSLVAILAMVFFGTLVSNLLVTFLLYLWDPAKYTRLKLMLSQVFLFTLLLFLVSLPFYLIAREALLSVAASHFLLSALVCALVCEVVSGYRFVLTGLMGVLISGTFLYGVFSLLLWASQNYSLLVIFFLPLTWICIVGGVFLIEVVHEKIFGAYGYHPLSPEVESYKVIK